MTKINWIVRLKNPVFWIQIITVIIITILTYFSMQPQDVTSWAILGELLLNAVKNPYLVVLVLINLFNILVDPTTKGIGDSEQALTYTEPKK